MSKNANINLALFRDRVTSIIEERGLRQVEVARATDISPSHLNDFLRRDKGFSEEKVRALASFLEISVEGFFDPEQSASALDARSIYRLFSAFDGEGLLKSDFEDLADSPDKLKTIAYLIKTFRE